MGFYHRLVDGYYRLVDGFARTRIGAWIVMRVFSPLDKRLLRWSNGALSSAYPRDYGANAVLLRCTGAKSGKPRDIPLLSKPLDGRWVLIASAGGQKKNPDWYYNLKAHPHCTLLVSHRGEIPCIAREAEGVERDRAWQAANTQYPGYATYQQRTQRRIPVMMLEPEN